MPSPLAASLAAELEAESRTTRAMLSRVPADRLTWRPHPKSMTLGQLALHIASLPRDLSGMAGLEGFDASQANFESPQPAAIDEVLQTFDDALATGLGYLGQLDDGALAATWQLTNRGALAFAMPRAALLRGFLFNHWYHHRGQLSVYLRLLDVPLPVVYGRTADENPFAT